jgi:hypothetical protein
MTHRIYITRHINIYLDVLDCIYQSRQRISFAVLGCPLLSLGYPKMANLVVVLGGVSCHKVWWPKTFGRPSVGKQPPMITIFRLPISIATKTFWLPQKGGGLSYVFGKPLTRAFPNRCHKLAFYGNWKIFNCWNSMRIKISFGRHKV